MLGEYILIISLSFWCIFLFIKWWSFFVSCCHFLLEVYFVWHKYFYLCFLLVSKINNFSTCVEYYLPSLYLGLIVSWGLKWFSCRQQIFGLIFLLSDPATLYLLIGDLNPFTLRLIINMGELITILSFVFWVFCMHIFSLCFYLPL